MNVSGTIIPISRPDAWGGNVTAYSVRLRRNGDMFQQGNTILRRRPLIAAAAVKSH